MMAPDEPSPTREKSRRCPPTPFRSHPISSPLGASVIGLRTQHGRTQTAPLPAAGRDRPPGFANNYRVANRPRGVASSSCCTRTSPPHRSTHRDLGEPFGGGTPRLRDSERREGARWVLRSAQRDPAPTQRFSPSTSEIPCVGARQLRATCVHGQVGGVTHELRPLRTRPPPSRTERSRVTTR